MAIGSIGKSTDSMSLSEQIVRLRGEAVIGFFAGLEAIILREPVLGMAALVVAGLLIKKSNHLAVQRDENTIIANSVTPYNLTNARADMRQNGYDSSGNRGSDTSGNITADGFRIE